MTKRPFDVENKENIFEQPSSSNITSSSDKNDPVPAKKAKIIHTEKVQVPEPLFDDDDDDEEKEPWPIAAVIGNDDGKIHPTNKQYFVYENTEPTMISRTARFWSRKYLKVIRNVNPDLYNMYIHNDFACYGELEDIENCLTDMVNGIFAKYKGQMNFARYVSAFRRLEALTIVLDSSNNFANIDDGDRFDELIDVIGACYVTILRGLLPKSMFDNEELNHNDVRSLNKTSQQLPNFKEVMKRALILGRMYLSMGSTSSAYTNILQMVYCKWSLIMDKAPIDLNGKPERNDQEIWDALKHAAGTEKNAYLESFDFMEEFELYSKNHPGLGGHSHDLRKWSKVQRNLYSFDSMDEDEENDSGFWFRL